MIDKLALLQRTRGAGLPIEAAFLSKAAPVNRRQRRQVEAQRKAKK